MPAAACGYGWRRRETLQCGMADHTRLIVWQRAHALSLTVHRLAPALGPRKAPGLASQLMRATDAIAANIAEGAGQEHRAQFARFLGIAIASAHEVENHLALAMDLGLLRGDLPVVIAELQDVRRMLYGLRKRIRDDPNRR